MLPKNSDVVAVHNINIVKSADVVIGANFGDEGKGLITDFLSAQYGENALIVRFNGGAQAGHTVVTPDRKRHAFSHHGSGSFVGAATFLSRFFVCNPLLFKKEHDKLQALSFIPPVYIDKRCIVTTPYDMMINQMAEEARNHARHGSCGVGFGETIERHEHEQYRIFYDDLADSKSLKNKLLHIRLDWLPQRLKALGIETIAATWQERIASEGILQKYLDDVLFLVHTAEAVDELFLRDANKNIIFEGAQGLLLEENHSWFPHVTRSRTGLYNVIILAEEACIDNLKTSYITRAYLTRHGAGPLPNELEGLPHSKITDETNIHNEFQGSLRFAWLDADLLAANIRHDLQHYSTGIRIEHGLAVTCMDQVDGSHVFIKDGTICKTNGSEFLQILKEKTGSGFMLTSHGPSRNNVAICE